MSGDEDVGKGKEARQFIVLKNLAGVIFEEEALLPVVFGTGNERAASPDGRSVVTSL